MCVCARARTHTAVHVRACVLVFVEAIRAGLACRRSMNGVCRPLSVSDWDAAPTDFTPCSSPNLHQPVQMLAHKTPCCDHNRYGANALHMPRGALLSAAHLGNQARAAPHIEACLRFGRTVGGVSGVRSKRPLWPHCCTHHIQSRHTCSPNTINTALPHLPRSQHPPLHRAKACFWWPRAHEVQQLARYPGTH